jgi:hypothetical protein
VRLDRPRAATKESTTMPHRTGHPRRLTARRIMNAAVSLSLSAWGPVTAGLFASLSARDAAAALVITNAGSIIYQNEALVAQPPTVATVAFSAKSNPVLAVVKTANSASGAPGQRVEYSLALTYPQIGGVCGDDSNAVTVTLTDTVPAGMTYVVNSTSVSVDNGTTFGLGTDAVDGVDVAGIASVSLVAGRVQVTFVNPVLECATGATTRIVKFAVTVN